MEKPIGINRMKNAGDAVRKIRNYVISELSNKTQCLFLLCLPRRSGKTFTLKQLHQGRTVFVITATKRLMRLFVEGHVKRNEIKCATLNMVHSPLSWDIATNRTENGLLLIDDLGKCHPADVGKCHPAVLEYERKAIARGFSVVLTTSDETINFEGYVKILVKHTSTGVPKIEGNFGFYKESRSATLFAIFCLRRMNIFIPKEIIRMIVELVYNSYNDACWLETLKDN
jgi:hypothetical protein